MIRHSKPPARPTGGFTLIELMVVMVILAVLLTVALPGFSAISLSSRLKSYANELVASANLARSEAIKRNVAMRLCASSDGSSCAASGGWDQGWIVMDPNDVVVRHRQPLDTGYRLASSGGNTLTFQPSGITSTQSVIRICRAAPNVGHEERNVTIAATGRSSTSKTTDGTCP